MCICYPNRLRGCAHASLEFFRLVVASLNPPAKIRPQITKQQSANIEKSNADSRLLLTKTLTMSCKRQNISIGAVRIMPWYPHFTGSHFDLPPSSIDKITGLGGKMAWTMTYAHRPYSDNSWSPWVSSLWGRHANHSLGAVIRESSEHSQRWLSHKSESWEREIWEGEIWELGIRYLRELKMRYLRVENGKSESWNEKPESWEREIWEFSQTFSLALQSTTEFFVFQQSFYWTRRFDPETRAFFGYTSKLSKQIHLY